MGWSQFLEYVQGPGISVVVGVLLSFVVEYWPKYQTLEAKWKRLVFMGLSFVVPLAGAVASSASGFAAWGDWATHWWPALVAGAAAFFGGQVAHVRKLG
jgi:fatty acid desaturase